MINQVFQHCRGIGPVCESRLKAQGISTWDDFFIEQNKLPFNAAKTAKLLKELEQSKKALQEKNISYLLKRFPSRDHWRILNEYFEEAVFFDIEISDLNWYDSFPTVIAAYSGKLFYHFTWNNNLDDFLDFIHESSMLVSFNGLSFDMPYLQNYFHIPPVSVPHIDLRWIAYHQGYRGGLKVIERMLQVHRPESIGDVDGFEAVELFHRWNSGNEKAGLELIQYCRCDAAAAYLCSLKLLSIILEKDITIDSNAVYTEALNIF